MDIHSTAAAITEGLSTLNAAMLITSGWFLTTYTWQQSTMHISMLKYAQLLLLSSICSSTCTKDMTEQRYRSVRLANQTKSRDISTAASSLPRKVFGASLASSYTTRSQ